MVVSCPRRLEAENIRGTFLENFSTNYVRNELGWGSRYHTNLEFFYAVADMDKIEGQEKRREYENQLGARFGACMWIYSKAVLSPRPEDMENF